MCKKLFSVINTYLRDCDNTGVLKVYKDKDTPSCTHGRRLGDATYNGLPGVSQGILSREYGEVKERSNVISM